MKYLKLFENSNELYYELDAKDFHHDSKLTNDIITTKEFDDIKKTLSYIGVYSKKCDKIFTPIIYGRDMGKGSLSFSLMITGSIESYAHVGIKKSKDEWFFVYMAVLGSEGICYKCDQMEGLLQLFKDKL